MTMRPPQTLLDNLTNLLIKIIENYLLLNIFMKTKYIFFLNNVQELLGNFWGDKIISTSVSRSNACYHDHS